jgi:hypothetical protein
MLQARPSPSRSLTSRLRDGLVAAASFLVVLAGIAYVFAPSASTIQLGIAEITGLTPTYDVDLSPQYALASAHTADRRLRYREVVYGKVQSRGVPVSDVTVVVQGVGKGVRDERATIHPRSSGTYRAVLSLEPGRYQITVTLRAGGKKRGALANQRLRDDGSYEVSVRVRESGGLTMLPISSY